MIDHSHNPDNPDRNSDQIPLSDPSNSSSNSEAPSPGNYYYDDATGYEVYEDEDECEEE